jgi:hypothetical protein
LNTELLWKNVYFYQILAFTVLYNIAAAPLLASATLPRIETKMRLNNHAACFAQLPSAYNEQRAKQIKKMLSDNGSSREVVLTTHTNGVAITNRSKAQYIGRLWYHNGAKNPAIGQKEISHSWEELDMRCDGSTLISGRTQGYTLSTFEPTP